MLSIETKTGMKLEITHLVIAIIMNIYVFTSVLLVSYGLNGNSFSKCKNSIFILVLNISWNKNNTWSINK